jgi:hypothetical protein
MDCGRVLNARCHRVGKINHLPTPHSNSRLVKNGRIVQLRPICRTDALSFDCGMDYWMHRLMRLALEHWLDGDSATGRRSQTGASQKYA